MSRANAPLTPAVSLRLIERPARPLGNVAVEADISRPFLAKWKHCFTPEGEEGPDQRPLHRLTRAEVVELIEDSRRTRQWTARQIHTELTGSRSLITTDPNSG